MSKITLPEKDLIGDHHRQERADKLGYRYKELLEDDEKSSEEEKK